jgi:hypothetical protein
MAADLTQFDVTRTASGDMDLVHASKNGNTAAFEQLVRRYDANFSESRRVSRITRRIRKVRFSKCS